MDLGKMITIFIKLYNYVYKSVLLTKGMLPLRNLITVCVTLQT